MKLIANEIEFGERLVEFARRAKQSRKWANAARHWESALKFRLLVRSSHIRAAGFDVKLRTFRVSDGQNSSSMGGSKKIALRLAANIKSRVQGR